MRCQEHEDALAAAQQRGEQPSAAALQTYRQCMADLRSDLEAVPEYGRKKMQTGVYVPPREFQSVLELLNAGSNTAVYVHGSPGLGKSAMARHLEDRYHNPVEVWSEWSVRCWIWCCVCCSTCDTGSVDASTDAWMLSAVAFQRPSAFTYELVNVLRRMECYANHHACMPHARGSYMNHRHDAIAMHRLTYCEHCPHLLWTCTTRACLLSCLPYRCVR